MCETTPFSVLSNEDLTIIPEESSVEKGKLFVKFVEIRSFWVFAEDFFLRNEDDDGKNFFQFGKYFSQMKQRKRQNHFFSFSHFSVGKSFYQVEKNFSQMKTAKTAKPFFSFSHFSVGKSFYQVGKTFFQFGKNFFQMKTVKTAQLFFSWENLLPSWVNFFPYAPPPPFTVRKTFF